MHVPNGNAQNTIKSLADVLGSRHVPLVRVNAQDITSINDLFAKWLNRLYDKQALFNDPKRLDISRYATSSARKSAVTRAVGRLENDCPISIDALLIAENVGDWFHQEQVQSRFASLLRHGMDQVRVRGFFPLDATRRPDEPLGLPPDPSLGGASTTQPRMSLPVRRDNGVSA